MHCFLTLLNSLAAKFPYLVQKKLKEGQEIRRVAQLDWRIIESSCDKPFIASDLQFVPLPVSTPAVFKVVTAIPLVKLFFLT